MLPQIKRVLIDGDGNIITPKKTPKTPRIKKEVPGTIKRLDVGNGHWLFPEQMGGSEYVGFIYAIIDPVTHRGYIGKKQYRGTGKLNKGQDSGWRKYISSCKALQDHIKERGTEAFQFYCLEQYKAKGALGYAEVWSQCRAETPTSEVWYNTLLTEISWRVKEPITQRHRERLDEVIRIVSPAVLTTVAPSCTDELETAAVIEPIKLTVPEKKSAANIRINK